MTGKESSQFLLLVGACREPTIAPLDCHEVIGTNVGRHDLHAVARLSDIVETGIVHDARRCAHHPAGEGGGTERVGGIGCRSNHVMSESEGMSHLMAGNETDGIADEFVRQVKSTGTWVGGRCLHTNPLADERLHVVPPDDVRLQNLAGARVESGRTHGICLFGGSIGEDRITHVVTFNIKGVVRHNDTHGIFEPSPFEGFVPIENALCDIRTQMGGHCTANVERDGLHWLHQFSTHISQGVTGHETPTGDVVGVFHLLLTVTIDEGRCGEIAHTPVFTTGAHRFVGQQHDGCADHNRQVHL